MQWCTFHVFINKLSPFLKCKQVEIISLKNEVHKWPHIDSSFGIMLGCAENRVEGYKFGTIYFGHGILGLKFIEQIYMS